MRIKDILARKGFDVHAISCEAPLLDAAKTLTQHNIGLLVCTDGSGGLIGIISERDFVRAAARYGAEVLSKTVSSAMVRDVIACGMDDDSDKMLTVMTDAHCRHLPVVHEGRLAGLVSIGDLVKCREPQSE